MLRSLLSGNCNAASKTAKFVRFASLQQNLRNPEQTKLVKEKLGVTLCGLINQAPIKVKGGGLVIPLLTRNAHDDLYAKHYVFAPVSALKNVVADHLVEGVRVYATGVIRYLNFQSAAGHSKQHGQILSTNLFLSEQNDDPSSDINDIILFGHVKQKPRITENVTFLKVNTKYFDRQEQNYKSHLHDVMITDNEGMREKANCLDVGVNVSIHGFLVTQFARNEDGKFRGTYLIRPQQLIVHLR